MSAHLVSAIDRLLQFAEKNQGRQFNRPLEEVFQELDGAFSEACAIAGYNAADYFPERSSPGPFGGLKPIGRCQLPVGPLATILGDWAWLSAMRALQDAATRESPPSVPDQCPPDQAAAWQLRIILHNLEAVWLVATNYTLPPIPEAPDAQHETLESGVYDIIFGHPPRAELAFPQADKRELSINRGFRQLADLAKQGHTRTLENLAAWQLVRELAPVLLEYEAPDDLAPVLPGTQESDYQASRVARRTWRRIWGRIAESIKKRPMPDFVGLIAEVDACLGEMQGTLRPVTVPKLPGQTTDGEVAPVRLEQAKGEDERRGGNPDSGPKELKVSEAAKAAGCYPWEITRAADSGELKSNGKKGRDRRIDAAHLSLWMLGRANRPEPEESDAVVEEKLKRARSK